MSNLRTLLVTAGVSAILSLSARSVTPAAPLFSISFEVNGETGSVVGSVTAPTTSTSGDNLAPDSEITVSVTRSNWALQETDVEVATLTGLAPGESVSFTDNASPAWQYGYQYTYVATSRIGQSAGSPTYASLSPGFSFSFAYNTVTATPVANANGSLSVELSALVPSKTNDQEDIPCDMTALEFYRVTDRSTWPYTTQLIGSIDNPTKGESYKFIDENPVENTDNYYVVKCVSNFGFCETTAYTYVGYDTPRAPYPVSAVAIENGVKISWTAPTEGQNWGDINPADTYYIVYRCWGPTSSQREQIASGLKECEYIDYGTDMEFPRAVRYEVQAANSVGLGGSNYSGYNYDLLVGPAEKIPFMETFDGGANHVWSFANSSNYCQWLEAEQAEFNDGTVVEPHSGTGLIYIDYAYSRGNVTNEMTSYKINTESARNLAISFWHYSIPDTDIEITVLGAKDGGEMINIVTIPLSQYDDESKWCLNFIPVSDFPYLENARTITLRLHVSAKESLMAAIFDDIALLDYPAVGNIDIEYDSENCSAILTWEDPAGPYTEVKSYEGFVDGQSVGEVESPWTFKADDYRTPYSIAVKAIYESIDAPLSAPVTVSVPRPPYSEFSIDDHVFEIMTSTIDHHEVWIKEYHGSKALYSTPESVTYDDVSYDVVGIAARAYEANSSLVSVSITDNIAQVSDLAFEGCSSMQALSFGTGLENIGQGAFRNCSSLATVIFNSPTVPNVAPDAFEGIAEGCKGKCPEGTATDYAAVPGLSPIDFGLGAVGTIFGGFGSETDADVEYYDLQGRRVNNPAPGQLIIARGSARLNH